ncbi:MAG: CpsD/CapB family tyrosine-protein kinase, partial [Verrucomicrobiota bacterium]
IVEAVDPINYLNAIETLRQIRTRLVSIPSNGALVLAAAPVKASDSFTNPVADLARVLADAGHNTLVIDANFRAGKLASQFEAANEPGLSDFLSGEMRLSQVTVRSKTPNLWFVPPGPVHIDPCHLLTNKRMEDLLFKLKPRFRFILIAAPPLGEVSDTAAVLSHCAHSVVTIHSSLASKSHLSRLARQFESHDAPILAAMLVKSSARRDAQMQANAEDSPEESDPNSRRDHRDGESGEARSQ